MQWPACLCLDSRYNKSLFDSNHFNYQWHIATVVRTKLARKVLPRCACSISANSTIICYSSLRFRLSRSTTCKTRPAGRVRPATRFCPAREMFQSYNGNRPAASHRPPLHYTNNYGIESLGCLLLHRLKTNVTNNVRFFDNALLNAWWIVYID